MNRDPRYAPPATDVADPPAAQSFRPRQVQIAVALLWLSLALCIPELFLSTGRAEEGGVGAAFVVVLLPIFALIAFLNIKVYQGRNWARIVLLVLTALSMVVMVVPSDESQAGPLMQGLYLLDVLIEVAAMYLVFTQPGSLWFKGRG